MHDIVAYGRDRIPNLRGLEWSGNLNIVPVLSIVVGVLLVSGRVVRVSRKNTIYIPKDVAERVGIREGVLVEITVEGGRIILTPIPDPLWLALHGPKFAEISVEDVERASEEMQRGLADEDTP